MASVRASRLAAPPAAGLLFGARAGQVAAQLAPDGAQTCSPSPGHRPGADLSLPARLRRQPGAPPGTALRLLALLVACSGCLHATSGAAKGLRWPAAGRLGGRRAAQGSPAFRQDRHPEARPQAASARAPRCHKKALQRQPKFKPPTGTHSPPPPAAAIALANSQPPPPIAPPAPRSAASSGPVASPPGSPARCRCSVRPPTR